VPRARQQFRRQAAPRPPETIVKTFQPVSQNIDSQWTWVDNPTRLGNFQSPGDAIIQIYQQYKNQISRPVLATASQVN
jgi:hypothetical protein